MARLRLNFLTAVSYFFLTVIILAWLASYTHPAQWSLRVASSYRQGLPLKFVRASSFTGGLRVALYTEINPTGNGVPYTTTQRAAFRDVTEPAFTATPRIRHNPLRRYKFGPHHGYDYLHHLQGIPDLLTWSTHNIEERPHFLSNNPDFPGVYQRRYFSVAYAPIAAIFALLPLLTILRILRTRPRQSGICHACGYDLRASFIRCPECGTVPHHAPPP